MKRKLRIHGDNIVECERTIKLIAEAFDTTYTLVQSPIYLPKYIIETKDYEFEVELLSGHGRWGGIDLGEIVHKSGGKLRETADSYITEIKGDEEIVLLSLEYCSALPAGNNAWQRNGRAMASVFANVPYLYYAEIGGVELDENRNPKAPRYPNPAVPFSYASLSYDMEKVCLPIYIAHPSMTKANYALFTSALGYDDGLRYIKAVLTGLATKDIEQALMQKTINMVQILSENRHSADTLKGIQWKKFLMARNRTRWLHNFDGFTWKKKSSSKVCVSCTYPLLVAEVESLEAKPITSRDLPLCVIPKERLVEFKHWIAKTYNGLVADFPTNKDLAIVWITGFKPHGDDSRPDRGLSPLCRMLLGKNANIMAVVYGPAKPATWDLLLKDKEALCQSNGLFQSIYECCNYVLIDSYTCPKKLFSKTDASFTKSNKGITFPYIQKPEVNFYEHDTDCAIHQIMSAKEDMGIFECFCNPPGGDWSGITYFRDGDEYKWTSLPRVSKQSKRPDHIIQVNKASKSHFIVIESKGHGRDLENNIGNRLKDYISSLLDSEPTAYEGKGTGSWSFFEGSVGKIEHTLISVGAFIYNSDEELAQHLTRGKLEAVMAFEFGEMTTLHLSTIPECAILEGMLREIASKQGGFIVKVH